MRPFSCRCLGSLSQYVLPSASSRLTESGSSSYPVTQLTAVRCRASYLRIANRKRVEQFVAKRFHLPTRLRTAAPDIAQEWDYEKNEMHEYPEIIGIGHMEPVWWRCARCSGSYHMSVEKRVLRGGGCPHCAQGIREEKRLRTEYGSGSEGQAPLASSGAQNDSAGQTTEEYVDIDEMYAQEESTNSDGAVLTPKTLNEEDLLEGEKNVALRPKRPTVFNLRTKY